MPRALPANDLLPTEYQVLMAVVVDRTFTSGGVPCGRARARLFVDHRFISFIFCVFIFAVGVDREIILTANVSLSTVFCEIFRYTVFAALTVGIQVLLS